MKLFFIRHANTDKGTNDDTRVLTEKGRGQAKTRGEKLGIKFNQILVSPKARALETAQLITEGQGHIQSIAVVPYLFTPQDVEYGKILTAMAERLTYASLNDYYQSATRIEQDALESYKRDSWWVTLDAIINNDADGNVLIVGHAVLLPLTGYGATESADFLPIQLGECEGFTLELDNKFNVVKHTFIKD